MKMKIFVSIFLIFQVLSLVKIKGPPELRKQFKDIEIEASYSNFGNIPYGYNLKGKLYYDPKNLDQDMACKPITSIKVDRDPQIDEAPIVMIDRGNCTFVTKIRNVEKIKGHIALIVDKEGSYLKPSNIIMSDDGTGKDITIPGVLISHEIGKILQSFYKNNPKKNIIMEVDFEMEHPSNRVNFNLYFRSDDVKVYKMLKNFKKQHSTIADKTNFQPHYVTYSNILYNLSEKAPIENCFGAGAYCASPKPELGISDGRIIVEENLRQKCIWKISNKFPKTKILYWDYLDNFYDLCISASQVDFSKSCSEKAMKQSGMDIQPVLDCVIESFDRAGQNSADDLNSLYIVENSLLKEDKKFQFDHQIDIVPTMLINNRIFWGAWKGSNIFEAICAGFLDKPQPCYTFGAFKKRKSALSSGMIALIILVVILANALIFLLCKKYIAKQIQKRIEATDINHRINTVVTSYLALQEGGNK